MLEAIEWMKQLAMFKPDWIEEPTSPDDILGHAAIAKVKYKFVYDIVIYLSHTIK